jgi:hypothetical protein
MAMVASPSPSPTIARSTPVSGVVLPELQPASAAPVERQASAELEEPLESAAALGREAPRARAANLTQMAADPSCPEPAAWSAILTPSLGSPGDYRQLAAASGHSERGSR